MLQTTRKDRSHTHPQSLHPLFHVTPFANDSASNSRSACWKYFAVSTPCYIVCQISPHQRTTYSPYLVVIHKVEHGHNVQEDTSISRVPRSHTLHVVCELGGAVQRLAALDPVDHLPHVLVDFSLVFCHAVESHCAILISFRSSQSVLKLPVQLPGCRISLRSGYATYLLIFGRTA